MEWSKNLTEIQETRQSKFSGCLNVAVLVKTGFVTGEV